MARYFGEGATDGEGKREHYLRRVATSSGKMENRSDVSGCGRPWTIIQGIESESNKEI